jgi:hypothetical protein
LQKDEGQPRHTAYKCRCRGRVETESDRTLKKCLKPGTIGCARVSPPGRGAYDNLATTVAWKMSCIMPLGMPRCLSVCRANNVLAHAASKSSTCGLTESFLVNETPSASTDSIRAKPKVFGGTVQSRLHLGDTNAISVDLTQFNCKLFLLAHDSNCSFQTHMTKSLRRVR